MAIGYNTIIPTTEGYKTAEEIKVGDIVFGLDNKLLKVTQTNTVIEAKMYKLVFVNDFERIEIVTNILQEFPMPISIKDSFIDYNSYKSVSCDYYKVNDVVKGGNRDFVLIDKIAIDNQPLRNIYLEDSSNIFKVLDNNNKNANWINYNEYNFPSIFIY